jgi:hypothetical protein
MLSRVSLREGRLPRLVERVAIKEEADKDNIRAAAHMRGGSSKGVLRWQRRLKKEQWRWLKGSGIGDSFRRQRRLKGSNGNSRLSCSRWQFKEERRRQCFGFWWRWLKEERWRRRRLWQLKRSGGSG